MRLSKHSLLTKKRQNMMVTMFLLLTNGLLQNAIICNMINYKPLMQLNMGYIFKKKSLFIIA